MGGATFGFVAGGFVKPRYRPSNKDRGEFEDEPVAQAPGPKPQGASGRLVVDVRTDDEREFEQALAVLDEMNPDRLDRFNERGQVVATSQVGEGRSDSEGPAPGRKTTGIA